MTPISCARTLWLGGALLALVACGKPAEDWRPKAIAEAEQEIRTRLADPAAQFSRVQMTGDASTGQTCGYVTAKPPAAANGGTGRFIDYNGHDAGPFIELSVGISTISQSQFEFQWEHDCLDEGYKP